MQTTQQTTLLERLEDTRRQATEQLDPALKKRLGQFMTPASVASFMASLFEIRSKEIHLLDAGAGVGSLTTAFVERACATRGFQRLVVDAFELDPNLANELRQTLGWCEARCRDASIDFQYRIRQEDFIQFAADEAAHADARSFERYDAAILNPPYAKINSNSAARIQLRRLNIETSNLYSGFVAITIKMLKPGGQMVAITPRSFCNGTYFRPFRQLLLNTMRLRQIHVYESRNRAFKEDEVLQENIILHAEKDGRRRDPVLITSSRDPHDSELTERLTPFEDVVSPLDPEVFIHVATSRSAAEIARKARALPCSLDDLGLNVSTGRVVDFRATEFLRQNPGSGTVPLIYPAHFSRGYIAWPTDGKKPNAIAHSDRSADLLVPDGCYTLTKRFTAKEERKRIVAALYDPARLESTHGLVGFENHLNYFHENGWPIDRAVALGLSVFLNSSLVDDYFRQFSGHTQVNATDLRSLRYPTRKQLAKLAACNDSSDQQAVDRIVNETLTRCYDFCQHRRTPIKSMRWIDHGTAEVVGLNI